MRLFPKLILSSVSILLASVHLSAQNGVSSLLANLSSSYSYVLSRIMTNASGTASLDHVDYDNGLGQTYQMWMWAGIKGSTGAVQSVVT
jgi:hypothetical protein